MKFKKTVLKNGVRVISEHHADSRCVVTGFWVTSGTRFEERPQMGISHLLEHMVFKRTEKYSALELAMALEAKGGDINAFTAREHTCFHTTSLAEDMELSVDVLAQLVAFAKFDQGDFAREKGVVEQEIMMSADDLEEFVFDLYFEKIFPNNSLGFPILGNHQSVGSLTIPDLQHYYDRYFMPQNIIVAATGRVDHDELVAAVEKSLQHKIWKPALAKPTLVKPPDVVIQDFYPKDCEQYHLIVGFPACAYDAEDRFNGYVINTALGGGMTSKLFQSVREERGLVYSIFSMLNTFTDTGIQTIYAGTEKKHVPEVVDLIRKELKKLKKEGMSKADIELYKTQAKGQIVIGSEDIDNRMNSIAVNEMVFGEYRKVEDVIADINKVNQDTVMAYIDDKLDPENLSYFTLGSDPVKF